jgi:hypothetical protein
MDADSFIAMHPRIFHAASATAWPSIQEHGLLSSARLLELFGVERDERQRLLTQKRNESVLLKAPGRDPAFLRDQKPLKFIEEKIEAGSSVERFLLAINSRVFFWPTRERLERLRSAKEYRDEPQVVLHIDTRALLSRYEHDIRLCRFNSGAVTQKNHPVRGHDSWVSIGRYPYDDYRKKYGTDGALAEVTVLDAVPDVLDFTVMIEHVNH